MHQLLVTRIKGLIEENNLSVQGLEKKAGLKINAVRNILTGQSKKPSAETLMAIAKALNCSISDLLEDKTDTQSAQSIKVINFSNHGLFGDIVSYIVQFFEDTGTDINSLEFIHITHEIYKYSIENNNARFDERFAKWFLSRSLK